RTSRLCSLWPDMRSLRFRRVPFGRDVAFDPGGATASRIAMPHILPSTVPSISASATFFLSWLNPTPHPIAVYASHPPSPTTAQHSLPGSALPPYRGRSFTGRNASASPDAPELKSVLREAGTTTIYVTHDQTEAMGLADRMAVLHAGHIQQVGPPAEVYASPATTFVGGFV